MFGMKGFHVSASGAIQGHHGPLVELPVSVKALTAVRCGKAASCLERILRGVLVKKNSRN